MPKLKLTDSDRRKIIALKDECPCLTNAALARIFYISPSRISEVLREERYRRMDKKNIVFLKRKEGAKE